MNKTEAAEIIANDVLAWSIKNGTTINKDLVEARLSELGHRIYAGTYKGNAAAAAPSWRTILRIAKKWDIR